MSVAQQLDSQSQKTGQKSNKSTVERAIMIQQRDQLRQMILQRLINDHAKGKERNIQIINDLVSEYFVDQKVSDSSLKVLKQQVIEAMSGGDRRSYGKSIEKSITSETKSLNKVPAAAITRKQDSSAAPIQLEPIKNTQKAHSRVSQSIRDDQSLRSSKAPKSVYMMDGDEEDEWATLVKFDTELFKKEQELEKIRQQEFKKKIKHELDKQLDEKRNRRDDDCKDETAYVQLADYQRNVYDNRESEKQKALQKKVNNEKMQRDKQVRDEYNRKKVDLKREKELDDLLVRKIKEELDLESQEQQQRRSKEKERLLQMMKENEEYRKKALEEAKHEKNAETQMQQQYINLQNQLEEQREKEKQDREEKMKKVMGMYAETVVKDQKDVIKFEDEKMLRNILDQNEREKIEDYGKKQRTQQQRVQMRSFLNSQIEEKKKRQQEEYELNTRQAMIWQQDLNNYNDHEKKKNDVTIFIKIIIISFPNRHQKYIKEVNHRHADILKNQMFEKDYKKRSRGHKMNTIELLQNKNRLKDIAINEPEIGSHVKKVEIMPEIPQ